VSMCVCVCVRVYVSVCVRECVCVCVRVHVRVILSLMCVILTSRGKLQPNDKENLKRYWTDRERTELLLFNVFILQGPD